MGEKWLIKRELTDNNYFLYNRVMELKIGAFRTCSAKQLDALLTTEEQIIISVRKHPRFVVSKYDFVKPEVEIKQKLESEGELIESPILDKKSFLDDTTEKEEEFI